MHAFGPRIEIARLESILAPGRRVRRGLTLSDRAIQLTLLAAISAAVACGPPARRHSGNPGGPGDPESPIATPTPLSPHPTAAERASEERRLAWVPQSVGSRIAALYREGCADGSFYLEAEEFEGLWTVRNNLLGFSGLGFLIADVDGTQGGAVMTKRISVANPGVYRVWSRGYHGGDTSRRWIVKVDGVTLDESHGALLGDRFEWELAGDVWLSAGNHDVHIAGARDPDAIADAVVLSGDAACNPRAVDERWSALDPGVSEHIVLDEILARTRRHTAPRATPPTLEDWQSGSAALRERVLRAAGLDPLPDRTPLHARVLGQTAFRGYRIERVVFESYPGLLVTANAYVPDGAGPFPAVLHPIGHDPEGKAISTAVARGQALARLGYIALAYDPFGYGERAIEGNDHEEHFRLILTGHANTSITIWDSVRAIDYLVGRGDVDPTRIAISGESGGGQNSLFTSIVDPRITASAPVVYMTSWNELLGTGNQHDACTHVPGLASFTELGEVGGLFAPRPQLFMNADEDTNFTVAGAVDAEKVARPIYELLGAGANLRAEIFSGGHEYSQPMRETFYAFVEHYLNGATEMDSIPEPEALAELGDQSPVIQCFDSGYIPEPATTARTLGEAWALDALLALPADVPDHDALRRALEGVLNPPRSSGPPIVQVTGEVPWSDRQAVQKLQIQSDSGMILPALFLPPKKVGAPIIVIVDAAGNGKQIWMSAVRRVELGALYVSPRGQGETAGDEYLAVTDNIVLGDSLLGQRAFDIAQARRALRSLPGFETSRVGLLALGPTAGIEALIAQALWRDFDAVAAGPMMGTYLETFDPGIPLSAHVAGMLRIADVPHIALVAAERPLRMTLLDDVLQTRFPAWYQRLTAARLIEDSSELDRTVAWLAQRLAQ